MAANAEKQSNGGSAERGGERPRLLLMDGHSMAYRAYYALKEGGMSSSVGQPTFAIYGFASMLANTLRAERPSHLAVAFDVSRKTFRAEEFPEYKANRSASPEDFRSQVELIGELLDVLRVPHFRSERYEADDILATLATQAAAEGFEVLIVTGDRDALQLVTDDITVLYPTRGVSEMTRFTPAKVEEKYGLSPSQYPDFAALRGDPSDNLPGIPGVGEKTATKWIVQYGSFAGLVEHADEVKGKVGANLREHLEAAKLNRRLTELVRDVELPSGPAELVRQPYDRPQLEVLLDALEFRNDGFRERLFEADPGAPAAGEAAGAASGPAKPAVELDGTVAAAEGELAGWLAAHAGAGVEVGAAVESEWALGAGRVKEVALAVASGAAVRFVPEELAPADESAWAEWLGAADRPKVLHIAKQSYLVFAEHGWPVAGVVGDTGLAAYLDKPGRRAFGLEALSEEYLGRELAPAAAEEEGQLAFGTEEVDDAAEREAAARALMLQARTVLDLMVVLRERLAGHGELRLLDEVELPVTAVLAAMERTGVAADRTWLDKLREQFSAAENQAVKAAHEVVGKAFNLGSPKQLQEILFEEMKLPKTKRTKTGYTTDADALTWLATQTESELPGILLRYRNQIKLRGIVEGLIKFTAPDDRIHTTFNQMVAATGRLSSVDPNLQNIPVRTEDGRMIRRALAVGPGYESLMTADYSQIELRVMAHLSEDAGLLAAFASGEDLHTTVGSQVFGVEPEAVDAEMRRKIKAMSYGLAYGLSAFGLSQQLSITSDEARGLMDTYFERFGGVREYLRRVVDEARATGYTETILGRRRYLPDLNSDNRQRREMAERMALNAPIQGSAADIVKVAMLRVEEALRGGGLGSRLLLQVHDEFVLEIAPGERDPVEALVREQMANAYPLRAALEVSVGVGANWEAAAH